MPLLNEFFFPTIKKYLHKILQAQGMKIKNKTTEKILYKTVIGMGHAISSGKVLEIKFQSTMRSLVNRKSIYSSRTLKPLVCLNFFPFFLIALIIAEIILF